jgi:hypothetical protein
MGALYRLVERSDIQLEKKAQLLVRIMAELRACAELAERVQTVRLSCST